MTRIGIMVAFAALVSLTGNAQGDESYGDWWVIKADSDNDYIAATAMDNGSKLLGYRCFSELQSCAHVLVTDTECEDGGTYPILVNSDVSSLSLNAHCSINGSRAELLLPDFDAINTVLKKGSVIGFAIPMVSGQFKVVRFSLRGSAKAMARAEEKAMRRKVDSAEYY